MSQEVPIPEKLLLTIKEAAIYSNIGINRIDSMLREDGCPFVLFVGSKKLVKGESLKLILRSGLQFSGLTDMPCCLGATGHVSYFG